MNIGNRKPPPSQFPLSSLSLELFIIKRLHSSDAKDLSLIETYRSCLNIDNYKSLLS